MSGYRADVNTEATGYVVNAPLLLNSNDEISTPKSEDFDNFILLLEIRSVWKNFVVEKVIDWIR